MTDKKSECCNLCRETCLPQIDGTRFICTNHSCPCHQPPEQSREEWDKELERRFAARLLVDDRFDDLVAFISSAIAKARAEEREAVLGWHPIATAPHDGTHILVKMDSVPVPTVVHWFADGFYLSWNRHANDADYGMERITHWRSIDDTRTPNHEGTNK